MAVSLRLGVVGTGRMAATMSRTIATLPGIEVTAVASSDPERARRFSQAFSIPHACDGPETLAARPEVDAVYVANRSAGHFSAAMAALMAGKPVLVEKPLAISPEDVETLVATARTHGHLLVENHWCLVLPSYRKLFADMRSGRYGDPVQLTFDFGYPVTHEQYPSLYDPVDGGVLLDRAIYGVSFALDLLGPVRSLACDLQYNDDGVDIAAAIQLRHATGAVSQLAFALNALMSNTATLACTRGMLRLDTPVIGAEVLAHQRVILNSERQHPVLRQTGREWLVSYLKTLPALRRLNRLRVAPKKEFVSYGSDPYKSIVQHFCELICNKQTESPMIPLDLSINTMRAVAAARMHAQGLAPGG